MRILFLSRRFPNRSPRIRHRNEVTERDWENAVQGPGGQHFLTSVERPLDTL